MFKKGDPLTPFFPSLETAYRVDPSEISSLPKIMAQCIGYGLAAEIFNLLEPSSSSNEVPLNWIGFMKNVSYSFGGYLKNKR